MIAFRYTKINGAEYLSHLDLLRHIERTLRRAGIPIKMSEGFVKHPRIFMNSPMGLGTPSWAEYATVDTDFTGDFQTLFNANAPLGVQCLGYRIVDRDPNFAHDIVRAAYEVQGLNVQPDLILSKTEMVVTDKRNRQVDIRPRIFRLEQVGDKTIFELGCGHQNLRPDLFVEILQELFGGTAHNLIKTQSFGEQVF